MFVIFAARGEVLRLNRTCVVSQGRKTSRLQTGGRSHMCGVHSPRKAPLVGIATSSTFEGRAQRRAKTSTSGTAPLRVSNAQPNIGEPKKHLPMSGTSRREHKCGFVVDPRAEPTRTRPRQVSGPELALSPCGCARYLAARGGRRAPCGVDARCLMRLVHSELPPLLSALPSCACRRSRELSQTLKLSKYTIDSAQGAPLATDQPSIDLDGGE
ncbi:Uncharacterised protein [Xylophilus ampelinus]|nr:Uncharacterised protein [Xylophilus ampelinus]